MPESKLHDFSAGHRDSLHQFEALFNFASIGIVVTNGSGEIINFNGRAESQFGYSKSEILGSPVEVLLPASVHARHVDYRQQYYKHPAPRAMGHGRDLLAQKKDGTTFPVEVSLSYYQVSGETFVIAFVIDITVRKANDIMLLQQTRELERKTSEIMKLNIELEQKVDDRTKMLREALVELEKSKDELNEAFENEKELSEMKSRFVTMASHEFRTPLSTILSSAYLLEKYNEANSDPKIQKHLQRIKGAVSGMKSILEDFLSLGKLEEGLVENKMEWVQRDTFTADLTQLAHEMETLLKPGQEISVASTIDKPVYADMHLLKNILINLLSNAIKFTGENETILVGACLKDGGLEVSVRDKGIGISEEDQQHLSERFFRAKNAFNIQGTGLGLHIVAKYLQLMNGRLHIDSKLDVGSVFTIVIPQRQNDQK